MISRRLERMAVLAHGALAAVTKVLRTTGFASESSKLAVLDYPNCSRGGGSLARSVSSRIGTPVELVHQRCGRPGQEFIDVAVAALSGNDADPAATT